MRTGIYFIFVVLFTTAVPESFAASFNCEKATSSAEKMICSDKNLSLLDEELQAAYQSALQSQSNKKAFKDSQIKWLKEKRNVCENTNCMTEVYRNRIKELNETISRALENILPAGISNKYRDIAKKSNSNVCEFILALARENLIDEFIEENLKAARISNLKEITFQEGSAHEKGDAFRFFIDAKDPSTEIIWFREFGGSANCQHDAYFKMNKEGKFDNSEKLNKLLPWCSDGDCCGGAGHTLFQFGGMLYSYDQHYDDSNNFRINGITKNGTVKVCEFEISHSKIKNTEVQCADDKVCKEIQDYIKTNLKTSMDGSSVNNCDFTDFNKNVDLGGIDKENIQCCSNIDFNNDGLKDLACIRDWPSRFRGKVHFLQKEKSGKYNEIIKQWKNSFLDQHWNDSYGFNISVFFIKTEGHVYTIDYSFNEKTPGIGAFEIYLVQDDVVNKVGKIIVELERNIKLIKSKNKH